MDAASRSFEWWRDCHETDNRDRFVALKDAQKLERALRASIAYDEARFEYIRFRCFNEVPERLKVHESIPGWVETVLETAEETTGEEFRKLRDAALGIPEND